MSASTEIEQRQEQVGELDNRRLSAGLAEGNGVIDPARWQMLAAIAETVAGTTFVPKGLRGDSKATLACLLYGDALGLQPMTSLKEVHVIDGTPGLSAAAMAALVRKGHPGHRMGREELRDTENRFLGVRAFATRGDTAESDEYTFTLEMAARAGLTGKDNWKKYPEAMCTARAYSQLCTFLFPDVFMGSPYLPEEIESFADIDNVVEPKGGENGVIVKPPTPEAAAAEDDEPPAGEEQTEWEVANADTRESITYIGADDRRSITEGAAKYVKFPEVDGKFEIVGYEVDGATSKEKLLVRPATPEPGTAPKPAEGTPEAVVGENIPVILGKYVGDAQQRGDRDFIAGVLEAEKAGKARGRLVKALEEILETMDDDARRKAVEGDGTGADNPLLDDDAVAPPADAPDAETKEQLADAPEADFTPFEDGSNDVDAADDGLAELDPEIPFGSATQRAKVVRLRALCAVMEDQYPEQRAWALAGVVASAAKQWGGTIESLDDLDEHQLELIWAAAEKFAAPGVQFLALANTADIAKLGDPQEQG